MAAAGGAFLLVSSGTGFVSSTGPAMRGTQQPAAGQAAPKMAAGRTRTETDEEPCIPLALCKIPCMDNQSQHNMEALSSCAYCQFECPRHWTTWDNLLVSTHVSCC
eukprot:2987927-Amphidinium_carterae.1